MSRLFAFAALLLALAPATLAQQYPGFNNPIAGQFAERGAHYVMSQKLKKGGYILYFRHAQREKWDSVLAFDVYEMATGEDAQKQTWAKSVCLTHQGVEESRMLGKILKLAKVPVGYVAASPICRARQMAMIAFGRIDQIEDGLAHTPVVNPSNEKEFSAALERFLREVPIAAGKNVIVSAHENTLRNNPGIFASGHAMIGDQLIKETGFIVIRRDSQGKLHVVHRYWDLGEFATSAVDLHPRERKRKAN